MELHGTDTDTDTDTDIRDAPVYMIAYPVQYMFTRVAYTRASLTDILARKSARVGQVGGQVGEDRRACPARGKLNGEVVGGRTRRHRHPRDDPRAEVGEDVRVGVGVRVGPLEFQLTYTQLDDMSSPTIT